MGFMFHRCEKFDCDLGGWDVSSNKDMYIMFDGSPLEKNPPKWYR